ncbi:GtrA family protein [Roseibium sp. RKSG952]|nr:GtrA family protein [Roseibium sp. RKSG952]MTH99265.1 GtrA family protein [Roseibium sp. RKSG952]
MRQLLKAEAGTAGRFAVVGAAATGVHASTAVALLEAGALEAFPANIAGFVLAFCVSFSGHHFWSFGHMRNNGDGARRMRRFLVLALTGFLLNSIVLAAWLELTPWPDVLGILLSIAIIPGLTFLGARLWAFANHSKDTHD